MKWASRQNVRRILIANRGEIACRIMRTAQKMGLETVAVYSDADSCALHTTMADHAFYLGSSSPLESYLNIERILTIAEQVCADMVHPGYGFLSENAEFAQRCVEKKIQFVGPSTQAIADMGSKSEAKAIMAKAGVPLIPGYHGHDQSDQRLFEEAQKVGFPLLVKAASGGGGKGMRVVSDSNEFADAVASARREAESSFGDPTLLLESYLRQTRHVEVQIFFDRQGQGIYLFDRDCSLQRRHQKVIEEAPAPGLSDQTRKAMGEAAVAAGQAIGYEGAGTVEFLLAGDDFYFMEVNTRLQVEHPVTERITGLDLVEWQIRIANGENLPLKQEELQCNGHAIEARVYAEDPDNNFLPSAGRIGHLEWPEQDGYVRIDTGVQQGDTVSSYYDPMLAKVIAWGKNREESIGKLTGVLSGTYLAGLTANRDYLLALLAHPEFQKANLSTAFIDQWFPSGTNSLSPVAERKLLIVAALYRYETQCRQEDAFPFSVTSAFPVYFNVKGKPCCIQVSNHGEWFQLNFGEGSSEVQISWKKEGRGLSGVLQLKRETVRCRVIPLPSQQLQVFLPDCSLLIGLPGSQSESSNSADRALTAPMNGTVTAVKVISGQTVTSGSVLLTMEAMKMEHSIKAPREGVIASVYYQPGDQVESGAALIAYQDRADETV